MFQLKEAQCSLEANSIGILSKIQLKKNAGQPIRSMYPSSIVFEDRPVNARLLSGY